MSEVNNQSDRRKFLMGLAAGTGALLVIDACDPGPSSLANSKEALRIDPNVSKVDLSKMQPTMVETQISNEAKVMIARKNIVQLTRKDVSSDLVRRLGIAKAGAAQDQAGLAVVAQIDSIIASIEQGNKIFDQGQAPCW